MKSAVSVHLINRLHDNLEESATQIPDHYAPEDLHTFRVNFKKLRAFARFLNHTSERHQQVMISDDLKLCYRNLGSLRDWQLLQAKLSAVVVCTAADMKLVTDRILALKDVIHQIPIGDIVLQSHGQLMKHRFHDCHLLEAELYLDSKWQLLTEIAETTNITADQLHFFRKVLKDIFYAAGLLKSAKVPLYAEGMLPGRAAAYFDSLLKELGDFNDLSTHISLLDSIDFDSYALHLLSDEWKTKKQRSVKDIASTLAAVMLEKDYYNASNL